MSKKQILFLDFLTPKRARTLEVAKKLGYRLALASKTLSPAAQPFVDRWIQVDPEETETLRIRLQAEHAKDPFHGVISFWDRYVETMALVAGDLGLPGNSISTARATRDKSRMRDLLVAKNVPCPRYHRVSTIDELETASRVVGLPMIFKPVGGASSKGIFKISEASTLTAAFDLMRRTALPQNDKMFDFYTGQYLAEEFMVGSEFSVEGVAQNGQIQIAGVTEKWTTSDNFTERQHLFPARIGLQLEQQIRSVTESALKAIEFNVGAFHVELMSTSSGPKIVEINGRLGGDYITTHLVQLGRGIEIIGEAIKAAAGDPIDLAKHFEKAACVRFKIATQEGNVVSWSGLEEALATPGVIEIIIDRDVGSAVRLPPKKYGEFRLSAAIAQADNQASALESTEIAEKILQVELTPFPDSFESSEERI